MTCINNQFNVESFRTREQRCEGSEVGGRPGLPVLNGQYGLCGRKATPNMNNAESG